MKHLEIKIEFHLQLKYLTIGKTAYDLLTYEIVLFSALLHLWPQNRIF